MNIETFINKLQNAPRTISFSETMGIIDAYYKFTPTAFKNGTLHNKSDENLGSCKLFAFAKDKGFTKEETLACFGEFYFEDVLNNPNGNGHQNIRTFMNTGFEGLFFDEKPLTKK